MGNLRSVARALTRAGASPRVTNDPDALAKAEALVLPGQGAFGDCALALERGFADALRAFIATGRPYLGICLGMQALFDSSEEAPGKRGIGMFRGAVRKFEPGLVDASSGDRLK